MKVLRKSNVVLFAVMLMFLLTVFIVNFSQEEQEMKGPQYVQANPNPADIQQPDGSPLSVVAAGDEVINYTRTVDGYTLLQGEDGFYYYAELDKNGDLVISTQKAKHEKHRSKEEQKFLEKIQKYLEYSEAQKKEKKNKWKKGNGTTKGISTPEFGPIDDAFPSTGTRNMLVILGQFSDWTFVKTNSDFYNLMNTGSTSFKAYYQDNSYGNLTVNTTVVGPYTINMTMSAADSNYRSYVAQLVDAANNAGVNFANYDNNGDGVMDALYVIHAGYGEEYSGAPTYYIWSHSWELSTYARTYDGVYINSYATSPELRNLSGSTISAIGVICHEFGHNLGAPDYYDTDGTGSGGTAWDLKKWDLMAGGSWNNNGDTPAQHNMYTKWKFGWSNPTVITTTGTRSLYHTASYNEAYRINTTTTNEFFILENRQQTGWDAYLPGHGLCIFHIDGVMIDSLSTNTVNANPSHQGVDLEEADNLRTTSDYAGDPFPGTANKTSFTDTTTPNSKSWAGANTNKPVTGISESSGVINFTVTVGGVTYCTANSTNTNDEWIARVQIGTINNASSKSYYTDYTSISTNATRGNSVSVTLTPGYTSTIYTEYWRVWIDYNKDGDFADTGEAVFSKYGTNAQSGSFTVPTTASTGTTRMRVSMRYGGYASYCGTFTYGEVEDYSINIQ